MATWTQHQPIGIAALTERQREVLGHIAAGKTNPEIATLLGVSLPGVKWHVREVITKLGVETREDAAEIWREEHSLPRRLSKMLGGAMGLGTLKVTLGTSAAAGVAVASIGTIAVVHDMRATDAANTTAILQDLRGEQQDYQQQAAALAASLALYSEDEASEVALGLAMDELEKHTMSLRATYDGRPFQQSDLRVVSARLITDAEQITFDKPQSVWLFGGGRDIWAFELSATGFDSADLGSVLSMSVAIEDGGTKLLHRNVAWPESDDPHLAHYSPPTFTVGSFNGGDLIARPDFSGGWQAGIRTVLGPNGWIGETFGGPAIPGHNRQATGQLFGTSAWTQHGAGHLYGAAGPDVVRIEVRTEDGRSAVIEPQDPPAHLGIPFRIFGVSFPGAHWIVAARAYDASGNVVGTVVLSDHPWADHDHIEP